MRKFWIIIGVLVLILATGYSNKVIAAQPLTPMDVNVLVISYFPLDNAGTQIDTSITGSVTGRMNISLATLRGEVLNYTNQGVKSLTSGTKYHGYKNSGSAASLNYKVVDSKEFLQPLPISTNRIPWKPTESVFRPDYNKILSDVNICNYVDNSNVSQVWLWGYHYGNIEPVESDMSMGTNSRSFWNYTNYGDVSNSEQTNDMPICQTTYVLYNYNFGRGLGELLEDHGHQIEALYRFVDWNLWSKFQDPHGNLTSLNHCGWTHSPPNAGDWMGERGQYDWSNKTVVKSDCEDWKPDGGGAVKDVSCNTWNELMYGISYANIPCADDGGVAFKVWWMQNIPGLNSGLNYNGEYMRDWWEFYGNFDASLALGKKLTTSMPLAASSSPLAAIVGDIVDPNGKVDIYDYNQLLTDFGRTGVGIVSDINPPGAPDGKVDIYDYNLLLTNFGKSTP